MSKRNAIISAAAVLVLWVTGVYGQDVTMKRQEPTMKSVPMMKASPSPSAKKTKAAKKAKRTKPPIKRPRSRRG